MNKKYISPTIEVIIAIQTQLMVVSVNKGDGEGSHVGNSKLSDLSLMIDDDIDEDDWGL